MAGRRDRGSQRFGNALRIKCSILFPYYDSENPLLHAATHAWPPQSPHPHLIDLPTISGISESHYLLRACAQAVASFKCSSQGWLPFIFQV